MTTLANKIKENLQSQPSLIISDIKTFQWLRWNRPGLMETERLGGGNILSILGLFSVINYLAKVYKILESGKSPSSDRNAKPELFFTEEQAFKRLILDCPYQIIQPIQDNNSLGMVWKFFRNFPSHRAQIPQGNRALVIIQEARNIPDDQLKKLIKNLLDKSFTRINEHGFVCLVDKLIDDVENIREWIIEKLNKPDFSTKNMEKTYKWIQDNI